MYARNTASAAAPARSVGTHNLHTNQAVGEEEMGGEMEKRSRETTHQTAIGAGKASQTAKDNSRFCHQEIYHKTHPF
jgi:hypothetical protein